MFTPASLPPLLALPLTVTTTVLAGVSLSDAGRVGLTCRAARQSLLLDSGSGGADMAASASTPSDSTSLWAALCDVHGLEPERWRRPLDVVRCRVVAERRWRSGSYVRHDLVWRPTSSATPGPLCVDPAAADYRSYARVFSARLLTSKTGQPQAITVHESEAEEAEGAFEILGTSLRRSTAAERGVTRHRMC